MKTKRFPVPAAILLVFLLAACSTDRAMFSDEINDFETGDFLGMVYDSANRPCSGAGIHLIGENGKSYFTDVNGRFVIPSLGRGTHVLSVSKEGYESQEVSLSYTSRKQILYVRLISQASLIDRSEDAMEALDWNEADRLLARAGAIDPENSRYLTVRGTFEYLRGRPEEAVATWTKLVDKGHRDPYLYLMIADACQYGLEDEESAAAWLGKFLDVREDASVRERLAGILEAPRD